MQGEPRGIPGDPLPGGAPRLQDSGERGRTRAPRIPRLQGSTRAGERWLRQWGEGMLADKTVERGGA